MNRTCMPRAVSVRTVARRVVEVAGQTVHRVDHDGVAVADEREHRCQPWPVQVLAGEGAVDFDAVELPVGVLLQHAGRDLQHAGRDIADALTVDARLLVEELNQSGVGSHVAFLLRPLPGLSRRGRREGIEEPPCDLGNRDIVFGCVGGQLFAGLVR